MKRPKRPLTAYLVYIKQRKRELKTMEPPLSNTESISKISKEWKSMPEEEKKIYNEEAEKSIKQYREEMEVYKKNISKLYTKPVVNKRHKKYRKRSKCEKSKDSGN